VKCLLQKEERSRERLIVISDDLALPFGKIRVRPQGSHGGQNGLRSIIEVLGTNEFTRLRIGIAPEYPFSNARNYVLERFSKGEQEKVEEILKISAEAVGAVVKNGVEKAMAEFN
jgi:peptidyl-tRNA hydrolase, PTH1 family